VPRIGPQVEQRQPANGEGDAPRGGAQGPEDRRVANQEAGKPHDGQGEEGHGSIEGHGPLPRGGALRAQRQIEDVAHGHEHEAGEAIRDTAGDDEGTKGGKGGADHERTAEDEDDGMDDDHGHVPALLPVATCSPCAGLGVTPARGPPRAAYSRGYCTRFPGHVWRPTPRGAWLTSWTHDIHDVAGIMTHADTMLALTVQGPWRRP